MSDVEIVKAPIDPFLRQLYDTGLQPAWEQRLAELALAGLGPGRRQRQARIEFASKLAGIQVKQAEPAPEPHWEPPVIVPGLTDHASNLLPGPAVRPPVTESVNLLRDIEWVYRHANLKGPMAIENAARTAPSAGAVALLRWVREHKDNRKHFYAQMVPKVLMSADKLQEDHRAHRSSQFIYSVIDRVLTQALETKP